MHRMPSKHKVAIIFSFFFYCWSLSCVWSLLILFYVKYEYWQSSDILYNTHRMNERKKSGKPSHWPFRYFVPLRCDRLLFYFHQFTSWFTCSSIWPVGNWMHTIIEWGNKLFDFSKTKNWSHLLSIFFFHSKRQKRNQSQTHRRKSAGKKKKSIHGNSTSFLLIAIWMNSDYLV